MNSGIKPTPNGITSNNANKGKDYTDPELVAERHMNVEDREYN